MEHLGQFWVGTTSKSGSVFSRHQQLGIKVIAEGVETTQQRDLLQAAGCDFAQGFLISHPVPAQELEKILLSLDV